MRSKERLEIGDEVLSIVGGEFSWTKDAASPTLEDVNLTVKKGELVGVLGRVGAGKVCTKSCGYVISELIIFRCIDQSVIGDCW